MGSYQRFPTQWELEGFLEEVIYKLNAYSWHQLAEGGAGKGASTSKTDFPPGLHRTFLGPRDLCLGPCSTQKYEELCLSALIELKNFYVLL